MTDRELMQMALDALEAQFYTDGFVAHERPHPYQASSEVWY